MLRLLPILFFFCCTLVQAADSRVYDQTWLDRHMPWIVALLIGLLSAGVNLRAAKKLRESNEKNQQQQIDNVKEITMLQFKGTIASQNKQGWINDLREEISELITKCHVIAEEFHLDEDFEEEEEMDDERFKDNWEQLYFSEAKIKLLLNVNNEDQRELLESIDKMVNYMLKDKDFTWEEFNGLRSDVVDSTRKLFEKHWEKIKNLK